MKNIVYSVIVLFVLVSCRTEKLVNSDASAIEAQKKSFEEFASNHTEYRSYPASIKFFDPKTDADPGAVANAKMKFFKSSGLPDETNIWEWKQTHSFTDAISIYNNFIEKNARHESITVFKQYGAWLILTRLDLLSQYSVTALSQIYSLSETLIKTQYQGFQLLNYSLRHLLQHKYADKSAIKNLGNSILAYAKNDGQMPKVTVNMPDADNGRYPPGVGESLKKMLAEKYTKNQEALNLIKELTENI